MTTQRERATATQFEGWVNGERIDDNAERNYIEVIQFEGGRVEVRGLMTIQRGKA